MNARLSPHSQISISALRAGRFLSTLKVESLPGTGKVKVLKPLRYRTLVGELITVPPGFVCDETSDLLKRRGDWDIASVLHDWLYFRGDRSRAECDAIYREALKSLGVNKLFRSVLWMGVRLFAGHAWNQHRKNDDNQQGE